MTNQTIEKLARREWSGIGCPKTNIEKLVFYFYKTRISIQGFI